jgi:murein DD-endopeptidase MepM/ murein hydrolase activator NlpD
MMAVPYGQVFASKTLPLGNTFNKPAGHTGDDNAQPAFAKVYAPVTGVVHSMGKYDTMMGFGGYGPHWLWIQGDDGFYYLLAHAEFFKKSIKPDARVTRGTKIGRSSRATTFNPVIGVHGPWLHTTVGTEPSRESLIDPVPFLRSRRVRAKKVASVYRELTGSPILKYRLDGWVNGLMAGTTTYDAIIARLKQTRRYKARKKLHLVH